MAVAETSVFIPGRFLVEGDLLDETFRPDLLILNQPIPSFDLLVRLWRHARYRACADGGANRLFDLFQGGWESLRAGFVRAHAVYFEVVLR
jgi:thiamine pyrophosphokinase